MKKTLLISLITFCILLAGAVVALRFISFEDIKPYITKNISSILGRKVTIAGKVQLQLIPSLAFKVTQIHIANPDNMKEQKHSPFVRLDALIFQLQWLPLLDGEAIIKAITFDTPVIHLVQDKQENVNWEFTTVKKDGTLPNKSIPAQDNKQDTTKGSKSFAVKIQTLQINNGTIIYHDLTQAQPYRLDHLDAYLTHDPQSNKVLLKSEFYLSDQQYNMSADTIIENFASIPKTLSWNIQASTPFVSGKTTLKTYPQHFSFSNIDINSYSIPIKGALDINTKSTIPSIKGKFNVGEIDLFSFISSHQPSENVVSNPSEITSVSNHAKSKDQPFDLTSLDQANIDLALNFKGLKYRKIEIPKGNALVKMHKGVLDLSLATQDKTININSSINALNSNTAALQYNASLRDIALSPVIYSFTDTDPINSTIVKSNLSATATGSTVKQLLGSLKGNGDIQLSEGSFKGVNIIEYLKTIRQIVNPVPFEKKKNASTRFLALTASYTLDKGIIFNKDLKLKLAITDILGEGEINLVDQTILYRIQPAVKVTKDGPTSQAAILKPLFIPVLIKGPVNKPLIVPDLQRAIKNVIKSPEETVKSLKKDLKTLQKNIKKELPGTLFKDLLQGIQ